MVIFRLVGVALGLVFLAALGHEIYKFASAGGYRLISAGELWARSDANSLVGFQALIEKGAAPWLWSDIVLPVLIGPAWAIPLVPAALLLVLAWRRRRQHACIRQRASP